jgi:hypothetical protein
MGETVILQTDLALIIGLFPDDARSIRRIYTADSGFRSLCDDYRLARASLARFEARPDAETREEIPEYRDIIAELETEIEQRLRT